jgi:small-conductance mechanosensitive channel
MKTKVLAAVGISGLLMAGGVLSASASTSGYDLFKTAAKKTQTVNSFTAHVQGSLTDNGKLVYQVDALNTENLKDESGNSTVSVTNGGTTTKVDYYSKGNQSVVKSSKDDSFYVKQEKEHKNEATRKEHKDEKLSPQMQKDVEAIFDAVTKNYQDKITSKDLGNGTTELQLDLSKNQIPAVGQAVVSFFLKNIDQQNHQMENPEFGSLQFTDLKPQLPQLKNNISVSEVVLKGEVNKSQYLDGQEVTIKVSGDDVNGAHHDLVLTLKNQFNNINNSTVSGVDLTGKKVVNVEDKHQGHED